MPQNTFFFLRCDFFLQCFLFFHDLAIYCMTCSPFMGLFFYFAFGTCIFFLIRYGFIYFFLVNGAVGHVLVVFCLFRHQG